MEFKADFGQGNEGRKEEAKIVVKQGKVHMQLHGQMREGDGYAKSMTMVSMVQFGPARARELATALQLAAGRCEAPIETPE